LVVSILQNLKIFTYIYNNTLLDSGSLAQKPSAKALPRAALGKEPSGNFESAKRSLPRALYRAHGKTIADGKKNPRQRKTLGKEKNKKKTRKK
jgi:hypothetical protein